MQKKTKRKKATKQIHPAMIRATENLKKRIMLYEEAEIAVVTGRKTRTQANIAHHIRALKQAMHNWKTMLASENPELEEKTQELVNWKIS